LCSALFLLCISASAQEKTMDKFTLLDSSCSLLRFHSFKGWTLSKAGSRIILTKTDSILVATSYSDYKPGKPVSDFAPVRYKYQLFIDFVEKPLDFNKSLNKTVNDSIDKIIQSFHKKKYGKGEYYSHLEAIELLEKMKVKNDESLNNINIRFSDNCAGDWVPYEMQDIKYLPFEPPTRFMRGMEDMKKRIVEMLRENGI
jgi:hypothetical protein